MATKLVIIGSGAAGYTAAIYAARADLGPVLYEGLQPGGQLTITTEVENFPGFPDGVMGPELMEFMKRQAARFGTKMHHGRIESVDFSKRPFKLVDSDGKHLEAEAVIVATGASAKLLGVPGEDQLMGYGVSAWWWAAATRPWRRATTSRSSPRRSP
jgi:thioredoxin reductase (NADPH)